MKHKMIVLNSGGDSKLEWDPSDEAEITQARTEFEALKTKGYVAFSPKAKARLDSFRPEQEEILMVPRLVGG
ncbi:MAG TPA: hypothetical protein VE131_07980 [Terriglobales bacterium]|jgi:hypothetical protein|nr:hypothetical protein [Terriglobales bacterium]